jgi:hypothetical protein
LRIISVIHLIVFVEIPTRIRGPTLDTGRMSSSPLSTVSENEYLRTHYRPDCDYVDGFVLERNLGQHDHARLQGLILYWLMQHEKQWRIHAVPECRLKIRTGKYRVPDVVVLPIAASYPSVIEQPPCYALKWFRPMTGCPISRSGPAIT